MISDYKLFLEKILESPIEDITKYNVSMFKGVEDKLFFLPKIDTDLIVDFGCADGKILSIIKQKKPKVSLIGYDISKEMLKVAKNNVPNATFTDSWNDIESIVSNYENATLILSSVIHEVYSYSNGVEIKKFWNEKVFGGLFKYIIIRDMIPSCQLQKEDFLAFKEDVKKVNKLSNKKYLNSFEKIWGLIDNDYRTFLHWLLKYTYTDNWEREVKENYLPLTIETLYKKIPSNYKITYKNNFIYEPVHQRIIEDFGIRLRHTTHTKMIIEKIN
jgi:SAM-dependent methyltransferase